MVKFELEVIGGTKKQRDLVRQATEFYSEFLLGPYPKIALTIILKRNLLKLHGTKADCMEDTEAFDDESIKHRAFEIRLDSRLNIPGLLRCLAHEMVHVKQYYRGILKDTNEAFVVQWKGSKFDMRTLHYYDHPWELDAYSQEIGLYERFVDDRDLNKKSWYKDYDYA